MLRRQLIGLLLAMSLGLVSLTAAQDISPAPEWPAHYYAPYVYMGGYPSYFLWKMADDHDLRFFTLAFVVNGGKPCQAAWGGSVPVAQNNFLPADLAKLRERGGDVSVSFGGAAGDELATTCDDVESLTAQYQSVIDLYGLTHLDFDIEGDEMNHPDTFERRSQAIAALQAAQELHITFTIAATPEGLLDEGVALLQSAINSGVKINMVNLMVMDYWVGYAPDQMGQHAITAAQGAVEQLRGLYPDYDDAALWGMIGLTPMIGLNDVHPQDFTLDDAVLMTQFASENGVQMVSMWALDRDKSCVSNAKAVTVDCSGVVQEPLAYSQIFNTFTRDAAE